MRDAGQCGSSIHKNQSPKGAQGPNCFPHCLPNAPHYQKPRGPSGLMYK